MSNVIKHYGTKRHSGRYPWGSGKEPFQDSTTRGRMLAELKDSGVSSEEAASIYGGEIKEQVIPGFHKVYNDMKNSGKTEKEIADHFKMSIREVRRQRSLATNAEKAERDAKIIKMKNHGYNPATIAKELGIPETTVRDAIKAAGRVKQSNINNTAEMLSDNISTKGGYLDISTGAERSLGVTKNKLETAVQQLVNSGEYETMNIRVKQVTMPGQYTTTKILVPAGTTKQEVYDQMDKIRQIEEYTPDGGKTYWAPEFPAAMSRSRVLVRYNEEGGVEKDGMIELRPGCKDLDMGDAKYAQVRINIENKMYAKGMAVYGDESDFPPGIDMIVNSNRHLGAPDVNDKINHIEGVFKEIKSTTDADAAFGAKVKANGQYHYLDENGVDHLGLINKVNEEGDWQQWSKNLSSQFLSKQSLPLIKKQLNKTYEEHEEELNDIMKLTNPAVKELLLNKFADTADGAAVDLKATSMPRQQQHVIIPMTTLKDDEIYAPNYKDGEMVCLIRYPHEGIFEIAKLRVNNSNPEGKAIIGPNAKDAVGITKNAADKLSGADFDGDTVAVIPSNNNEIKVSPTLKALEGFDTKEAYPYREGMRILKKSETGMEMGKVSNLITDMTIKGASEDEIARAVKHAMVIIDAAKHELDYTRSFEENGIAELKTKYQGSAKAGAATLISRASARTDIAEREQAVFDEESGKMKKSWKPAEDGSIQYRETGREYKVYKKDKNGNVLLDENGLPIYTLKKATERHKKLEVMSAYDLVSDPSSEKEMAYADYSESMKALANRARKEAMSIEPMQKNKASAEIYKNEVESLNQKLIESEKNAPRERAAQIAANVAIRKLLEENPCMEKDELKKNSQLAMMRARAESGANKQSVQIKITAKEWEAIQAGAISTSKQREILKNADLDIIRSYATPRNTATITTAQQNSIRNFKNAGFTNSEIAERLGLSTATVSKYLN